MNDTTDPDRIDDEIISNDVSDDALEAAAGTGADIVTMGAGSCYMPGGRVC